LVLITTAESGGLEGKGIWKPATTGFTPGNENADGKRYLRGGFIQVKS
jgi:nitrate reductase alpha subunit